jgi:hypothetical protein
MNSAPLRIQLSWDNPATRQRREPTLAIPIALGREFNAMPAQIQGRPVSRMILNSLEVSRFHVLIDTDNGALVVIDQNSSNGTFFIAYVVKLLGLPNVPRELPLNGFIFYYSLVWLAVYITSQTLMQILLSRWRFKGGQLLSSGKPD